MRSSERARASTNNKIIFTRLRAGVAKRIVFDDSKTGEDAHWESERTNNCHYILGEFLVRLGIYAMPCVLRYGRHRTFISALTPFCSLTILFVVWNGRCAIARILRMMPTGTCIWLIARRTVSVEHVDSSVANVNAIRVSSEHSTFLRWHLHRL